MNLTPQLKSKIDSYSYEQLLYMNRFSPVGDPMFCGESGEYISIRMAELRDAGADHIAASKNIGWV